MNIIYIKNKLSTIVFCAALTITYSCKKLIEIPSNPIDQISEDQVFSDSADIMGAIAGVYTNYRVAGGGTNIFSGILTEYMGCAADELSYSYGNTFLTNTYNATDGTAGTFWSSAYTNLYYINNCINNIAVTTVIGDSTKQVLIAELKVNRAMNYFYLLNLYGGVPIVTDANYKVNANLARASEDSVYDFITSDLLDAGKILHSTYPSAGRARPNIYTAEALLARVYLYRGMYDEAIQMSTDVINSGLYSLVSDLNQVFLQGSNEAIWQLPAIGTSTQTSEGAAFIPYSIYVNPYWTVTSYFLDSLEDGDTRKSAWTAAWTTSANITYIYPNKYKQRLSTGNPVDGYIMLRFAEQYLIRAEASAEENKTDEALSDLNMIRNRAGLSNSTAVSQPEILSAIMRERKNEFFCEWGSRWFDLKRTGNLNAVIGKIKSTWLPTAALLPINSTELQNDPSLTQNPGY